MARGLAPVRLRSSRKSIARGMPRFLGLLRSPTGASPLATSMHHLLLHNFFTNANHRLSFKEVRSICVNGSVDYGRFVANRFE